MAFRWTIGESSLVTLASRLQNPIDPVVSLDITAAATGARENTSQQAAAAAAAAAAASDWKEPMILFLQESRHLREIASRACQEGEGPMTAGDFEPFATGLAHAACTISTLHLHDNLETSNAACVLLIQLLRWTSCIRELHLSPRAVTSTLPVAAIQGLAVNRSIEKVRLDLVVDNNSHENIRTTSLSGLLTVAHHHPTLRCLELVGLHVSFVPMLFQAMASNTTLTILRVDLGSDDDPLEQDGAMEMYRCFQVNTTLTEFRWDSACNHTSVFRLLYEAVKSTRAQTYLHLRQISLVTEVDDSRPCRRRQRQDASLGALTASLITESQTLVWLDLTCCCPFPVTCMTANLRALERNRTLQHLDLKRKPAQQQHNNNNALEYNRQDIQKLVDQLIVSLPRMSLQRLNLHLTEKWILTRFVRKLSYALSCNCSLNTFPLLQCNEDEMTMTTTDAAAIQQIQSCLNRNQKRREFLVGTEADANDTTTTTTTRANPPGLLALALATVVLPPATGSARYDLLRRNVHVLIPFLSSSSSSTTKSSSSTRINNTNSKKRKR